MKCCRMSSGRSAVLAIAVFCAPAQADTVKVSSGLVADVQDAIDAAAQGDTILVSGGPYTGGLAIPPGRDGLVLKAKGKVILDAHDENVGIFVDSDGVTVRGFTIRHAQVNAVAGPTLPGTLAGLVLDRCRFLDSEGPAVNVTGDDVHIVGCQAEGCDGGLDVLGDRARIEKTTVVGDSDDGISVTGDDALVSRCQASRINGFAILVTGQRAHVTRNRIHGVPTGIGVLGDLATVDRNHVRDTWVGGLSIDSTGATLDRNLVIGGVLVGLQSIGAASVVSRNKTIRCGGLTIAGLNVSGDGSSVVGNLAKDCVSTGIRIEGTGSELAGNVSRRNTDNGFLVRDTDNVLDGNTATQNQGEGIQNDGTGTILRNNKSRKNLLDLANSMAPADLVDGGGNVFDTGGFDVPPKVDP